MKHIKLFEQFYGECGTEVTAAEKELLTKLVKDFTKDNHMDIEEETSLIAICKKMGLKPSEVYHNNFVSAFKEETPPEDESNEEVKPIISHRTEVFLNRLICHYKLGSEEEKILKELCDKLGEDYKAMLASCKTMKNKTI